VDSHLSIGGLVVRLWRWRWWALATAAAVCVGAGLLSSLALPRRYEADTTVLFGVGDTATGSLGFADDRLGGTVSLSADVAVSLIGTRRIRSGVAAQVHLRERVRGLDDLDETLAYLRRAVAARTGGSGQVRITCRTTGTPRGLGARATGDEPARDLARDILQAYVSLLDEELSRITRGERAATRKALDDQFRSTAAEWEGTARSDTSRERAPPEWATAALTQLRVRVELARAAERRAGPEFHIIDPPATPLHACSPRPPLDMLLAAVAVAVGYVVAATFAEAYGSPSKAPRAG